MLQCNMCTDSMTILQGTSNLAKCMVGDCNDGSEQFCWQLSHKMSGMPSSVASIVRLSISAQQTKALLSAEKMPLPTGWDLCLNLGHSSCNGNDVYNPLEYGRQETSSSKQNDAEYDKF